MQIKAVVVFALAGAALAAPSFRPADTLAVPHKPLELAVPAQADKRQEMPDIYPGGALELAHKKRQEVPDIYPGGALELAHKKRQEVPDIYPGGALELANDKPDIYPGGALELANDKPDIYPGGALELVDFDKD